MRKLTIRIPQDRGALYERIRYPAGEIQIRLTAKALEGIERKEAFEIVANPIPDLMELALLTDALNGVQQFWERHLYLPYMPYARADRRFVKGDCFGLATWGRLLNALNFTIIWTFDVHSGEALKCIRNLANWNLTDLWGDLDKTIRKIGMERLALVLPDEGSRGRYDLDKYELPIVNGVKLRDEATGRLSGFAIPLSYAPEVRMARKALIVDDICDGGGTFIGLAEALHALNKRLKLYLFVSHGIFSKGQAELSKHFEEIFTSGQSIQMAARDVECNCGRADCEED